MERTEGQMERLPEKLEFELELPVWVKQSGVYWEIVDSNGKIFMGRKQKDAIEAIALFLNNFDEMASRWNAFVEPDGLVGEMEAVLKAIKIRIAFIGWPSEPKNESGPDWVKEIKLLEAVLTRYEKEVGE